MGNSSVHVPPEYHRPSVKQNRHQSVSSLICHQEEENMILAHFRGKLTKEECIYVLSTLMEQYFFFLRRRLIVVISDRLCKVDENGKVWVINES